MYTRGDMHNSIMWRYQFGQELSVWTGWGTWCHLRVSMHCFMKSACWHSRWTIHDVSIGCTRLHSLGTDWADTAWFRHCSRNHCQKFSVRHSALDFPLSFVLKLLHAKIVALALRPLALLLLVLWRWETLSVAVVLALPPITTFSLLSGACSSMAARQWLCVHLSTHLSSWSCEHVLFEHITYMYDVLTSSLGYNTSC